MCVCWGTSPSTGRGRIGWNIATDQTPEPEDDALIALRSKSTTNSVSGAQRRPEDDA